LEQVDEFVYLGGLLADYERIPFHSIHFVSGKAHSNNKKEKDIKKMHTGLAPACIHW